MKNKRLKRPIIAPSILAANFYDIKSDLKILKKAKTEWLHFDVMDGHFVNNISFGIPVFVALKPYHDFFNDVHIMVSDPLKWGVEFAKNGADLVTFHIEAVDCIDSAIVVIDAIRANGAKVGISIKPSTDVRVLKELLPRVDLVLVMSVEPGFGGQGFLDSALEKISWLRKEINRNDYNLLIEVDGGINDVTASLVRKAGADVLVAGSYLLKSDNLNERVKLLRKA